MLTVSDGDKIDYQTGDKGIIGHVPVELSKIARFFISRGGAVTAKVRDEKLHRSSRADGLVICTRIFFHHDDQNTFKKAKKLVKNCLNDMVNNI